MTPRRRLTGSRWRRLRREILDAAGWRCERCGRPGRLEVHHALPVQRGGSDDPSNLECLCVECHLQEHTRARTASELAWAALLEETP